MNNNTYQPPHQQPGAYSYPLGANPMAPTPMQAIPQPHMPVKHHQPGNPNQGYNQVSQVPTIPQPQLKSHNTSGPKILFQEKVMHTDGVIIDQKHNTQDAATCHTLFIYKVYPSIPNTSTLQNPSSPLLKDPILIIKQLPQNCDNCWSTQLNLRCIDPALGVTETMEFYVKQNDTCACEEMMFCNVLTQTGAKQLIGRIGCTSGCSDYVFKVYDSNGTVIFSLIGGGGCQDCCGCKPVEFEFYKGFKEQKLPQKLVRYPKDASWLGPRGTFDINFPAGTPYEQRCLCLGLAMMVDLKAFQEQSQNSHYHGQY